MRVSPQALTHVRALWLYHLYVKCIWMCIAFLNLLQGRNRATKTQAFNVNVNIKHRYGILSGYIQVAA